MFKKFAIMAVVLTLVACGESNQLIGKWEAEMPDIMKPLANMMPKGSNALEFTSSSMKRGDVEIKVDSYQVEKERIGVVVSEGNKKVTQWFNIIDDDTIEEDVGLGLKMTYHRIK